MYENHILLAQRFHETERLSKRPQPLEGMRYSPTGRLLPSPYFSDRERANVGTSSEYTGSSARHATRKATRKRAINALKRHLIASGAVDEGTIGALTLDLDPHFDEILSFLTNFNSSSVLKIHTAESVIRVVGPLAYLRSVQRELIVHLVPSFQSISEIETIEKSLVSYGAPTDDTVEVPAKPNGRCRWDGCDFYGGGHPGRLQTHESLCSKRQLHQVPALPRPTGTRRPPLARGLPLHPSPLSFTERICEEYFLLSRLSRQDLRFSVTEGAWARWSPQCVAGGGSHAKRVLEQIVSKSLDLELNFLAVPASRKENNEVVLSDDPVILHVDAPPHGMRAFVAFVRSYSRVLGRRMLEHSIGLSPRDASIPADEVSYLDPLRPRGMRVEPAVELMNQNAPLEIPEIEASYSSGLGALGPGDQEASLLQPASSGMSSDGDSNDGHPSLDAESSSSISSVTLLHTYPAALTMSWDSALSNGMFKRLLRRSTSEVQHDEHWEAEVMRLNPLLHPFREIGPIGRLWKNEWEAVFSGRVAARPDQEAELSRFLRSADGQVQSRLYLRHRRAIKLAVTQWKLCQSCPDAKHESARSPVPFVDLSETEPYHSDQDPDLESSGLPGSLDSLQEHTLDVEMQEEEGVTRTPPISPPIQSSKRRKRHPGLGDGPTGVG